jgi:peptidoglycan/LPS O-acetylase OafA/YrhL
MPSRHSNDFIRVVGAVVVDVAIVAAFVLIGRQEHDEGTAASGFVTTAAPFLFGLAAGWLGARAWRRPLAVLTGVAIWAATVLVGMFTRRVVFDDGIAFAFIVVTTLFLGVGLVGWRAVASRRP